MTSHMAEQTAASDLGAMAPAALSLPVPSEFPHAGAFNFDDGPRAGARAERPQSRIGWGSEEDDQGEDAHDVPFADEQVERGADVASEMDEEDFVGMLNQVLRTVGLRAQVSNFDECAQASVFVAIFERLFQVRLSNVIRNPETYEDRVLNCQRVIDALGGVTNADIAADRICSGNFDAIASLITVFHELCQPESSRSASDVATAGERDKGEWWGRGSGPFHTGADSDESDSRHQPHDPAEAGPIEGRQSASSSQSDDYNAQDIYSAEAMFHGHERQIRQSSRHRTRTTRKKPHLRPAGADLEMHERIQRQQKYDARRARDMQRVTRAKQEKIEKIASNAALRDRRHQKVWAKQLAQQLQQEILSAEARREAQREHITKKLFMLALRQKRDMDINAEHAERERRVERRRRDNDRFQAWEQWYQDQCLMLDEEKSEEHVRHQTWERERQAHLREMERTVRSALIKQMQRIRNDIRQESEQYESRLGLDVNELEPSLRVLDQRGKQWRNLVKRIASQLVDAAELNRVATFK